MGASILETQFYFEAVDLALVGNDRGNPFRRSPYVIDRNFGL